MAPEKASDSRYTALGISKPCRPARLLCSSISPRMVSYGGGEWVEEDGRDVRVMFGESDYS